MAKYTFNKEGLSSTGNRKTWTFLVGLKEAELFQVVLIYFHLIMKEQVSNNIWIVMTNYIL